MRSTSSLGKSEFLPVKDHGSFFRIAKSSLEFERVLTLYRFGLSLATSIMLWTLVRKKPNEAMRRVRQNRSW